MLFPKFRLLTHMQVVVLVCAAALLWGSAIPAFAASRTLLSIRQGGAALMRGDYIKAVNFYSLALKSQNMTDQRRSRILNDRGVAKWRLKRFDEAIKDFNEAIQTDPKYALTYNNRGNTFLEVSRTEDAIRDFDQAISLVPDYAAAFNNRANGFQYLKKYDRALLDYSRAIKFIPQNAVPFAGRAKLRLKKQQYYAAIRDFSRAISLNAAYHAAFQGRGLAYLEVDNFDAAVKNLTVVIGAGLGTSELYLARAEAYAEQKRYSQAIADLTQVIKLTPDEEQAFAMRGEINYKLKRYKQAQADLDRAIALNENDAESLVYRIRLYLRLGLAAEALPDVNRVLKGNSKSVIGYFLRARINERIEEVEQAEKDYRKAVELDPSFADAKVALARLATDETEAEIDVAPAAAVEGPKEGWQINKSDNGRYIATNTKYPGVQADVEMYGKGKPRILEWTPLKGKYRGVGLLRYFAGDSKKTPTTQLEFITIINLKKRQVIAIEPFIDEGKSAVWTWRNASVVITDNEGISNEIWFRKVPRRARQVAYGERSEEFDPFAQPGIRKRRKYKKRRRKKSLRRKKQRKKKTKVFKWLFQ